MSKDQQKENRSMNNQVREALRSRGFSLKGAAERLEIKPEQLRQWLSRRTMPEHHLRAIAELAGLPYTELREKFDLLTPRHTHSSDIKRMLDVNRSIHDALRVMDGRVDEATDIYLETSTDIHLLVGAMRTNDLVIYCSLNRIPHEMEADGIAKSAALFAKAIENKAHFIYMHPGHDILSAFRTQKIANLLNPEDFENHYDRFCDAIARASDRLNPQTIQRHLRLIRCDDSAFMVPDFKFILFHPAESHEPSHMPPRLIASIPVGTPTIRMDLQLPMARGITNQFLYFARNFQRVHSEQFPNTIVL